MTRKVPAMKVPAMEVPGTTARASTALPPVLPTLLPARPNPMKKFLQGTSRNEQGLLPQDAAPAVLKAQAAQAPQLPRQPAPPRQVPR